VDQNNYVGQKPDGTFVVVQNGQVIGTFADQASAEQAYNTYVGGGSGQPASTPTVVGGPNPQNAATGWLYDRNDGPISREEAVRRLQQAGYGGPWDDQSVRDAYARTAGVGGGGAGGGSAGGYGGGGETGYNPGAANTALQLAQAAAQQAYLNERLRQVDIPQMQNLDARERERLAQEKARDAYNQAFQQAQLTQQQGQLTGYVQPQQGQGPAGAAQAAFMALPAAQRTAEAAARIWAAQNPGLSPQDAARMAQAGHDYYAATGQVMPDAVAQQHLARITGGRVTGQTPTLPREQMQNQTMLQMLDLQSRLRGPGDWVQYMQTVQSTPPELRDVINQAAGRFRLPGAQPGAASVGGLVNDLSRGPGAYAAGGVYGGQPSAAAPVPASSAGRAWGVSQPGMMYPQVEAPGNPSWEARNPQANPGVGGAPVIGPGAGANGSGTSYGRMPAWDPFQRPQPQTALPLANQLPRSFATASPDVQDMILSPYEAAGQSKRQVVYDFEKSLPAYGGPRRGVQRY
jgi:hypothetical protein